MEASVQRSSVTEMKKITYWKILDFSPQKACTKKKPDKNLSVQKSIV